MNEIWKAIPSRTSYEVSNLGRVRRAPVLRGMPPGDVLKPYPNHKGYLRVCLSHGGKNSTRFIHRLVLEAFVGPCPDGHAGHHRDHDQANNRLENLEYITKKENYALRYEASIKRRAMGAIPEILAEAWLRGWQLQSLATQLGVETQTLKNWLLRKELPHGRQAEVSQRLWSIVMG